MPSLVLGRRLGSYSVLRALGRGGMGEVYCAHDSRLARDVVLKILPPDLADDPSRRRRFEIEARAVASFSHASV